MDESSAKVEPKSVKPAKKARREDVYRLTRLGSDGG